MKKSKVSELHPKSQRHVIAPGMVLIAPDLGRIVFNLNNMTPSVINAIRNAILTTREDVWREEEFNELTQNANLMEEALISLGWLE